MKLPENAIGPTDVRQYQDCPRRFEYGMRRHTPAGEGPESQGPATAYGSAVHDLLAFVEDHPDATDTDAIQHVFDRWAKWLEPQHLVMLREDLDVYREREPLGVRTVAVEREMRVPLMEYEGQTIYLRGRIDRLYQRLDNPSVFVHVDYKSSAHEKSEEEVHGDTQLWAYNLLIHEEYPECETLVQLYDQLRFGAIPTRKSEGQRAEIRDWLVHQVTAILRDTELKPTHNDWCAWCPLMESCPVVDELSDFALARIAALAPEEKRGRKTVVQLDPTRVEVYVGELERVGQARKVLDRFDENVKKLVRDMPAARRVALGYDLKPRRRDEWTEEGLRAAHEVLGEDFYRVVQLTKGRVQSRLGKEDERVETILGLAERKPGAAVVSKLR